MLYGAAIAWSSRQQRAVALSTAEAEYVALTETGRDVVWIRRLLSDLNVAPTQVPHSVFDHDWHQGWDIWPYQNRKNINGRGLWFWFVVHL